MALFAMAMFIGLFVFGNQFFGWADPGGKIQLSLFSAFVFGMISGYKAKN
ncbi:MAG TPA: hypothetical protein VF636_00645 [Sphingomonas sp.]|jgi:hypothetical protein